MRSRSSESIFWISRAAAKRTQRSTKYACLSSILSGLFLGIDATNPGCLPPTLSAYMNGNSRSAPFPTNRCNTTFASFAPARIRRSAAGTPKHLAISVLRVLPDSPKRLSNGYTLSWSSCGSAPLNASAIVPGSATTRSTQPVARRVPFGESAISLRYLTGTRRCKPNSRCNA